MVRTEAWALAGVLGLGCGGSSALMVWELVQGNGPMATAGAAAGGLLGAACRKVVKWLKDSKKKDGEED
ncbi:hypothetical protein [Streptomyces lincolnensis]|uniref:hypothetical protein n=1 Tax=Streptomyces lincolnensis TaxID=1915 RepID=UPI0037D3D97B